MIKINATNQKMIDDFKNNRQIVEFEIDTTKSDDKSIVFYVSFKDLVVTEKADSDLTPMMLENRFVEFGNKESYSHKRRVAPYDIVKDYKIVYSVPTIGGSQDAFQVVLENLKNFIEEN